MKKILLCILTVVTSFTLFVNLVDAKSTNKPRVKCVYDLNDEKSVITYEIDEKGDFSRTTDKIEWYNTLNENDFKKNGLYVCPDLYLNPYNSENYDFIIETERKEDGLPLITNTEKTNISNVTSNGETNSSLIGNVDCDYLLGDPNDPEKQDLAYWLQWILNILKYAAIVALLVLSTIEFIKAIVQDDKDALRKALLTTGKRFIYAILIFFLPIIVEVLMKLLGAYGTCGIG